MIGQALVKTLPWIAAHIKEEPAPGDYEKELRIEIPSENPHISQPFVVVTAHREDGTSAPVTEVVWWERWSQDAFLTEPDPDAHIRHVVQLVEIFLAEESAALNAWFEGNLIGGGTLVPPDAEPFPVGRADTIHIRSWRGTFDRDLTGEWPGWPDDPRDAFYDPM
ncbi:MAG: hypothetical protein WAO58_05915 [Fimbriimonadaceae bacterium]